MVASVLHLRGDNTVLQPLVSQNEQSALCFNGEIFQGDIVDVADRENDAAALFESLNECASADDVHHLFQSRVYGPYAFAYWNSRMKTLFFGRDPVGRRSLIVHWPDSVDDRLLVSSIAGGSARMDDHDTYFWQEAEAGVLYEYRFGDYDASGRTIERTVYK